ncbi:F-box/kelch-repeat protein At1g15670-like [Castanea sativa]|uniref:F-box/kelch-repeat protein At1g15670-like n=1 Tax=Castanea sativa TaxID=21020 RepID=UPI003F64F994
MAQERDQCKVIFHRGKLHVIGGYCTELQGGFEGSDEAFEFSTWKWDRVKEDYFGANMCPKACVAGDNGKLYVYWASDVATLDKDTLKIVAQLLAGLGDVTYMTTWQEKLMVIESSNFGVSHLAYMLDFINYTWTKVESPKEYSGYVQSSNYLGI